MYCKHCYAKLPQENNRCEWCGYLFDPEKPKTYLKRPFPNRSMIVGQIFGTTIVGVIVACAVAYFQLNASPGH
jgi:hypothetical protein